MLESVLSRIWAKVLSSKVGEKSDDGFTVLKCCGRYSLLSRSAVISSMSDTIGAKELTLTTKETRTKEGKVVPPMTVKLSPVDEADGKAAKFVGTDPSIGNVADFAGTVLGEVDGKPSQGDFTE